MGGAKRYPSTSVRVAMGIASLHPSYDRHTFAISRRIAPEVLHFVYPSLGIEGAGKTGCALHPRSRVQSAQKETHTSIQVQRRHPAFPAQWLYGLLRALPGERLSCHRHQQKLASTDLTPAPRRQDHTTSPYASCAFVLRALRVHRISPHVRDDRDPPLICRETREVMPLICPTR